MYSNSENLGMTHTDQCYQEDHSTKTVLVLQNTFTLQAGTFMQASVFKYTVKTNIITKIFLQAFHQRTELHPIPEKK